MPKRLQSPALLRRPRRFAPTRLSPRLVRRRKHILWGAFFLLALGAVGWAVFFTHLFTVKSVRIVTQGRSPIPVARILTVIGDLKKKQANMLFLSTGALERRLERAFPELRKASVARVMFGVPFFSKQPGLLNEVLVSLEEREPAGTVCKGSEDARACFLFDSEGVLFGQGTSSAAYVLDARNVEHGLRYQIFDSKTASRLAETLNRTIAGLATVRLDLGDIETTFVTMEGWRIVLSNDRPAPEQFEAARIVLEREIGPRRAELEYIDTTIKNRVYYKYRQ